jgi:hypothetical protein
MQQWQLGRKFQRDHHVDALVQMKKGRCFLARQEQTQNGGIAVAHERGVLLRG